MDKFEDNPNDIGRHIRHPWWWIRVLLMVAFAIACAVFTVPIPSASTTLFYGSLLALFVLAAVYPVVTAYIATKLPSYLEVPWDRPQWSANPFTMHGPLHGPHFFYPILFAGAQGCIVGAAYELFIHGSQSAYPDKGPQMLTLFVIAHGLWLGTSAGKGLFVDAYRDELKTEADLSTRRTVELAVGLMWLFVLVAIPVATLGIVMYLR